MRKLIKEENTRYQRQMGLSGINQEGQEKLINSSVLIVGLGGLGSISALYLASAGVGKLGLADPDLVNLDNLPRQTLYRERDLGRLKVEAAKDRLEERNSGIRIATYPVKITGDNAQEIARNYDALLDAGDNFPLKYLLNDSALELGKPLVHAGAAGFEGLATTILPGKSPCYRCIFPKEPPENYFPTCREIGILGTLAGILGLIQATEAIKIITGLGKLLTGRLLSVNALTMEFGQMEFKQDPACRCRGFIPEAG